MSESHLWQELRRIDALVRMRARAWHEEVGRLRTAPEGLPHVSESELLAYLQSDAPPRDEVSSIGIEEVGRLRSELDAVEHDSWLSDLVARFQLDGLERDALLAILLPELDPRHRRIYGFLQDDASRTTPSLGFLCELLRPLADSLPEVRAAIATLRDHRLVVVEGQDGAGRPVRVEERIVDFLLGVDVIDRRIERFVELDRERPALIDPDERLEHLGAWLAGGREATLLLAGPWGSGRRASARAICARAGLPLLLADAGAVLELPDAVERTCREARLRGAAVLWNGCEQLLEQPAWERLVAAAETFPGVTFLATERPWDPAGRFRERPFVRLDLRAPGFGLRRRLWGAALPEEHEPLADLLANSFQFTPGQILDAVATARGLALQRDPLDPRLRAADITEAARRQSSRQLISFTRRVEPRSELSFDDLVLPAVNLRQLRELRERIALRGRVHAELGFERRVALTKGVIALFTGSSGTGKTMAAELLAREHHVDLYKVDLSAVVSKYVGDTEKNLAKVFNEAASANAIVFFDEADALFGQRGEVHDARDRWANMEVNFLLQRVEEYPGVVVLASNLRQNIDEAFTRRIATIVEFPFPDAAARAQILRGLFPDGVERPGDDDLARLAERFRLSGGSARNVVVDAAFRAVAEDAPIGLRHLVIGIAREYQKLGKPITRGEFGEEFYALVEEDVLGAA